MAKMLTGNGHKISFRIWQKKCRALPAILVLIAAMISSSLTLADDGWERYKNRLMSDEGRILDTGNDDVSHSEGQGWGMLLAESQADRHAFDLLWSWTRQYLARDDVALFSWRFDPESDAGVSDPNNASDGDVLIAWALQRAAERWDEGRYASAARRIRKAIRRELVVDVAGYRVLLPGVEGFRGDGYVDINLSYWVMPAFAAFAKADPEAGWERLFEDGQRLLAAGRFGRYRLPTDWLRLNDNGTMQPAPEWPPRFGFDAVRIPLYFAWAGLDESQGMATIRAFWNDPAHQPPPAWIDVISEARAQYPASAGVLAIRALANGETAAIPEISGKEDDYYSSSLILLARLAARSQRAGVLTDFIYR